MAKEDGNKSIDRKQVVDFLNRAFEKASEIYGPRSKAVKGTPLYEFQVDFSYLLDEIQRGPEASAKHAIAVANRLIATMNDGVTEKEEA